MKKLLQILAMLLPLMAYSTAAEAVFQIEARYWFADLDSNIQLTDDSIIGTDIDVVDDLGIDDSESFLEAKINVEFGAHHLRYSVMNMGWDGDNTLTKSVTFSGTTYTASTDIMSSLDIDYHRFGYEYDIIDAVGIRLALIAELKYFDIQAAIKSSLLDESESISAPIPTVGVAFQVGFLEFLNVTGEITGISAGDVGYMYDAEAAINFKPAPLIMLSGGYRALKFDIEDDDEGDSVDLTTAGPFLALKVSF